MVSFQVLSSDGGKSNGSTNSVEAQEPTGCGPEPLAARACGQKQYEQLQPVFQCFKSYVRTEDNRLEGEATAKIVVQLEDRAAATAAVAQTYYYRCCCCYYYYC